MEYFDINLNLSEEDRALRDSTRKFAEEVMRPIAKEVDLMSAEEAIAPDSPFWAFWRKAYELGYHKAMLPEEIGGLGLTPLQTHLVQEELAWGSFGFAALLAGSGFYALAAATTGNEELMEKFTKPYVECTDGSIVGCWGVTDPDHGSDVAGLGEDFFYDPKIQGSVKSKLDGDEWVMSGQKSAWVSGAPIATHISVHHQVDLNKGLEGWGIAIVPLDLPGVSKGKPLEKIGQRELCQGEVYFDEVRIPKEYMVIPPEVYTEVLPQILVDTNLIMGIWSVGLARAAFEEALTYCKERVQGGRPLMDHYSMKQRLFEMFTRVETARALSRAVAQLNLTVKPAYVEYSLAVKAKCTQLAYENAHDAVQILGGNGLTREYNTEKMFRDARASLIMDGSNEVGQRLGGYQLQQTYPRGPVSLP